MRTVTLSIMLALGAAGCRREAAPTAEAAQPEHRESAGSLLVDGITGRKHVEALHDARASIKTSTDRHQSRLNTLEQQVSEP